MKNVLIVLCLLMPIVGDAQTIIIKPMTRAQIQLREEQQNAENIWAEQDRQKAEFIRNIPIREFNMTSKTTFEGKFIYLSGGMVNVIRKDGKEFDVPMTRFSSADQKWIRDEIRIRKGLKPTPAKKVVAKKEVEVKSQSKPKSASVKK